MKNVFVASVILLIISNTTFSQSDSLWDVEGVSNATVLLFQKTSDTSGDTGSGTILNHNGKYFLLTANHVAKKMKSDAQIVFRLAGDKPGIINLTSITKGQNLNWRNHSVADISLIELNSINREVQERIKAFAFPSYLIFAGKQTVPKDVDITFLGYPLIDLQLEFFSPLVFNAYLASGLITQLRSDTKVRCNFFYLNIPSMQGCSGSGVYHSVHKAVFVGGHKTFLIGIVHGTTGDDTGGKLAAITPAYYIWDILLN